MYLITDKASIIRDVQVYLSYISERLGDPELKSEFPDGKYGERTASAVRRFQHLNALDPSGTVDSETFYSIKKEYENLSATQREVDMSPVSIRLPVGYGTSHRDIVFINTLLHDISVHLFGASDVRKDSYFSKNSEVAVSVLRDVFMLPRENYVDDELLARLIAEKRSIENFRQMDLYAF